jgi:tripartite-type tricarboxylate transporter receptor subunit TctC
MKKLTVLFLLFFSGITFAEMPSELKGQTITVVVPYAAGGGADTFSRLLAAKIKSNTGLSIIVNNKPGAFATIGAREVAEAKPDGLTLLGTDNAPVVMNPLMKPTGWIPRESFVTVSLTVITPQGIYVAADSKYNTLAELLAEVKKNPNKFSYGCAYNLCNLFISKILSHSQTEATAIPYKSTPQVLMDLSSGQIAFIGSSSSDALAMVQAGKVKPIAFSTEQRLEQYPTTPLFKDTVPDFIASNFHGVYAPVGTPKHIINYLNKVYRDAHKDPEVREQFKTRAVQAYDGTPEQGDRYVDRQIKIWNPVVEKFYKAQQ